MKAKLFLLLIPLQYWLLSPLSAQWPHRVETELLVTSFDTFAYKPSLASDGVGNSFVAWDERRDTTTKGDDIYVQKYDAQGIAQWTSDGVVVADDTDDQRDPIVLHAGEGSIFVLWTDKPTNNEDRVYAQLFNAAGQPQWTAGGVRLGTNEFAQSDLVAASDEEGNLYATWSEVPNIFRTFAQKIDTEGNRLWTESGMEYSSGAFGGGNGINIVADGSGGAVVGWIESRDNPRPVRIQRVLSDGTFAFDSVSFGTESQALGGSLAMAPDGTGGAIVGWRVNDGANDNLHVHRVDGDGDEPWAGDSTPLVEALGEQTNLQLVSDGENGAFGAWLDPRAGTNNVFVQRIDADGDAVFAENGISAGIAVETRFNHVLTADGSGGVFLFFKRNQNGQWAQLMDAEGNRLWGDNGVQVTENKTTDEPSLARDGSGGVILSAVSAAGVRRPSLKRLLADGSFPQSRLVNIATRAFVGLGEEQAIPGLVIVGSEPKNLLIRAVGPDLAQFGVPNIMDDPVLTLYDVENQVVDMADDWGEEADPDAIRTVSLAVGAFNLSENSKDAATLQTLAAGRYTTGVTGADETTGIALVEVYDTDSFESQSQIVNLSSRVFVGVGDSLAIPGFTISGPATMTVLIRAVGPTLEGFSVDGVLEDPTLTLFDPKNNPLEENDDWGDHSSTLENEIVATTLAVGAFELPANSNDSVLLVTLGPGTYTAGVTGAEESTGICLIEVYRVP